MRVKSRLLILAVLVSALGVVLGSVAQSRPEIPAPDYQEFRTFLPIGPSDLQIGEGEPFYFVGGVGDVVPGYAPKSYQIQMFINGESVEPTFVGCIDGGPEPDPNSICRDYLFDFPDGLEKGFYELLFSYVAPCGVWEEGGFGSSWTITGCYDKRQLVAHPELHGFKTLRVGTPEISVTPVEWNIELDAFGPDVHSIFTIAEASPLTEDAIDDLYGFMHWEETEVGLCTVHVRDVGPGYVQIGDGYSTGEGCDPPAMQKAFDDYGLPDFVCVGVTAYGSDYEYCAPLEVLNNA